MKTVKMLMLLILIVLCITDAYALEKSTHEAINEVAANASSANDYLTSQLKITDGLKTYYSDGSINKKAIEWIKLGGFTEDEPLYTRSLNHFLDPVYGIGFKRNYKTALEWAKNQNGVLLSNDCSWGATRGYYLLGLVSSTKTGRDNSLAATFECVGRLMHLVQDMSVPAHTRDDFHYIFDYEQWVKGNGNGAQFASNAAFYGAITSIDPLFLDLATYTNAHFFSDDTIFDPKYANPAFINTDAAVVVATAEDGVPDKTKYIRFIGKTENLAAYSYFSVWLNRKTNQVVNLPVGWHYVLDDAVYKDYAAQLLPRAVGYSANLLSHFFRGKIDMVEDTENPGTYKITNNSTGESMNGTFNLYYDDTNDNRNLVDGVDLSAVNGVTLAFNESASIPSFSEPSDIKEPGKYMLVFSGTLGQESGAVVGASVSLKPGIWEDFEGVNGFKQDWMSPKYAANEYRYEIVKGFGSNATNVLKVSGISTRGWDYMYVPISASMPMPKTISFDYFAKNVNLSEWGFNYLALRVSGRFPGGQIVYSSEINSVNTAYHYSLVGCGQYRYSNGGLYEFCNEEIVAGRWKRVNLMTLSQTGVLKEVYLFIVGDSEGRSYEVYIDNIDLKW